MFTENKDFYPTPNSLIDKMLEKVDLASIRQILEPSAGKGNIVDRILKQKDDYKVKYQNTFYSTRLNFNIDCIELDRNLQLILKGNGHRVIHDNFLTYQGFKQYDLIIANFPFSEGDKHLLKALELIATGGHLVCLVNAETIRNPYSNIRKDVIRRLEEYNATIEYLQEEFTEAERQTNVEVALIDVNVPKIHKDSIILNRLKQEEEYKAKESQYNNAIINGDFLTGIVQQYNFEVKVGVDLINEYMNIKPLITRSFDKNHIGNDDSILTLSINEYSVKNDNTSNLINNYIANVRYKYWSALFENPQFTSLLTSNLLDEYRKKVTDLQNYDFSLYNIEELQKQMNINLIKGVEETILSLFDEFSQKHWYDEMSKNIHYYNGWKTNSAYKINKKVIIPLNAYSSYWDNRLEYDYKFLGKIKDIEHVFDYLDDCQTEPMELKNVLEKAENEGQTKNIETKYFFITVYKKGTTHLTFKNEELLKKFNIFGSCKKGWLPNTYGKKKYTDMTDEEKSVIDDFEGEKEYNKTMENTQYYLYNPSNVLMIGGN